MRITDKRRDLAKAPLTFSDPDIGDWYEYVNAADAIPQPNEPRLKTGYRSCVRLFLGALETLEGEPTVDLLVRRLDVEIIIHGNL